MEHIGRIIRDPTPDSAREVLEFIVPRELHGAIGLNNTETAMDYIFDTTESLLSEAVLFVKDIYYDRILEMVTNILVLVYS